MRTCKDLYRLYNGFIEKERSVKRMEKEQQDLSAQSVIEERHAVRSYQPNVSITREKINQLLRVATKAPSGGNLQAWRFLVIDETKQKEKLYPIAFHQQQIIEASATIVALGDLEGYKKAHEIYAQAVFENNMPEKIATMSEAKYTNLYQNMQSDDLLQTVTVDTSLAAMQFMLLAKAEGFDTTPMRGFDKEQLAKAFKIPSRYTPVLLISLGKQKKPAYQTSRLPLEKVVFYNEMN